MNTKDLTPQQILAIGRAIACKYLPYYASAIYNLIPHETLTEPTLAVTRRMVLFYNPNYIKEIGPKYTAAVIIHEISHVIREHHRRFERMLKRLARRKKTGGTLIRRQARLWKLWGIATDLEINDGQPHTLPLPPGVLYPKEFGLTPNKLAEFYFGELLKKQGDDADPDDDSDSASSDDGSQEESDPDEGSPDDQEGDSGGSSSDDHEEGQEGSSNSSGDGDDESGDTSSGASGGDEDGDQTEDLGPGFGHCGSCAGPPKPSEPADAKLDGELGRSDAEMDRIRDQVAEDVIQHEKTHGGGSSGLLWWAKERLKPPVIRWQEQLITLARQAVAYQEGCVDYREDVMNEQQSALGWGPDIPLLPGVVAPIPEVMFLVDRSTSMSRHELTEVAQEVPGVLQSLIAPIAFGSFDTVVQEIKRVSTVQEALKLFKGGGGTDFRPIFEALKRQKGMKPDVLIIGTDGCGPAPLIAPQGVSVIWLLVGKLARKPFGPTGEPVEWGKCIYTNPELRAQAVAA